MSSRKAYSVLGAGDGWLRTERIIPKIGFEPHVVAEFQQEAFFPWDPGTLMMHNCVIPLLDCVVYEQHTHTGRSTGECLVFAVYQACLNQYTCFRDRNITDSMLQFLDEQDMHMKDKSQARG